jgi:hypothetical protein
VKTKSLREWPLKSCKCKLLFWLIIDSLERELSQPCFPSNTCNPISQNLSIIPSINQEKTLGNSLCDKSNLKSFYSSPNLEEEDPLIIIHTMNHDKGHPPFFITLIVNYFLLHNCMLDSGAFTNVMSLKVMNQLGL